MTTTLYPLNATPEGLSPIPGVVLVDTPGFDNQKVCKNLKHLLKQLGDKITKYATLSGIVYIHNITFPRVKENPAHHHDLLKKLCGPDPYTKVVFATTFWEDAVDGDIAEKSLCEHWGIMMAAGSRNKRFYNTSESAWSILYPLISAEIRKRLTQSPQSVELQEYRELLSRVYRDEESPVSETISLASIPSAHRPGWPFSGNNLTRKLKQGRASTSSTSSRSGTSDRGSTDAQAVYTPDPQTTRDCLSLVFDLINEAEENKRILKRLEASSIQEMADFILFVLYDNALLTSAEESTLRSFLADPASDGIIPRNILLLGIKRPAGHLCTTVRSTDSKTEAKLSIKIVKPASERFLEILDILDGLEYLHENALVHGNLTCDNVLVSQNGRATLTDFGSFVEATTGGGMKSIDRWMAPEVLSGSEQTKASDIWSFGCVVYHITSGTLPYWTLLDSRVRSMILSGMLPYGLGRPREGGLCSLMESCWKFDSDDRPDCWKQVRHQVLQATCIDRIGRSDEESVRTFREFWDENKANMRVSFDGKQVFSKLLSVLGPYHKDQCLEMISSISTSQQLHDYFRTLSRENIQTVVDYLELTVRDHRVRGKLISFLSVLVQETGCLPQCYELYGIELDTKPISQLRGISTVYGGSWERGRVCLTVTGKPAGQEFCMREIPLWAHLSHPNLLPFYGAFTVNGSWSPVAPYMADGNITDYILSQEYNSHLRLSFVLDVLNGLKFLHSSSIVHGNLKGSNILILHKQRAIIADFKFSSTFNAIPDSQTSWDCLPLLFDLKQKGKKSEEMIKLLQPDIVQEIADFALPENASLGRWAAPELLFQILEGSKTWPTVPGDIWSLGCVIYEILSRKLPYFQYPQNIQVIAALRREEFPVRPDGGESGSDLIEDVIWELLKKCWALEPDARPSCQDILKRFQDLRPEYQPLKNSREVQTASEIRKRLSPQVIDFYQVQNLLRKIVDRGQPGAEFSGLTYIM
ncbi:Serine/threonine-protein kinase fray1 [Leucoagaricus sp. SymC.cos]|nr:Serine/threonine-protein kinase fray1 [Leucoagaricus sp. SymC.cos]